MRLRGPHLGQVLGLGEIHRMTTTPPKARLGPYEILDELGEGGMGMVWRAQHVRSGREVALKAITASRANAPSYRRAFRREVEAVARVDHPLVTTIYDFGESTSGEADASGGAFRAGIPWLAMEYCDAGSMSDTDNRPRNATTLREILSEVLEALGYAHSRGIIHRDLKPENILVTRDHEGERHIRLADFGISQAVSEALLAEDTSQISAARAGTPSYMAPEQIVAEWRNWGSWTDLYALGVIAYEFASGRLPFVADNWIAVGQLHLQAPPPAFDPIFPMPEPFLQWIRRLLAKAPYERFERAADAIHALHDFEIVDDLTTTGELPSSVWASAKTNVFESTSADTNLESGSLMPNASHTLPPTMIMATTMTQVSKFDGTPTGSGLNYIEPSGDDRAFSSNYSGVPPMPADWRRARKSSAARDILSGGVSLFGLREVPLVGREEVRDALWDSLSLVRAEGRPRLTVLSGDAGVGKSAVARWFTQRADETGAGFILHATHEEAEPPDEGLRRMLTTILRCHGLERAQIFERVGQLHHYFGDQKTREFDVPALTQLIRPRKDGDLEDGVPRFRFPTIEARYEAATRLIRHLARIRPIVIWLDDAHWSQQSLQFADYILRTSSPGVSIHVVATVRSDLYDELPGVRTQLERLVLDDRVQEIVLEPLPPAATGELVDALVRLAPDLRDEVAEAAAGRPVHAVQLLGHLVESGSLLGGANGYRLRPNASVPANIERLWISRVQEAMSSTENPVAAVQAITLAAMLGMRIEHDSWVQICKRTGVGAAEEVLELFATSGLIERVQDAWRLRHDLLRRALIETSARSDESKIFHWMASDIIQLTEPESPERQLKIAQHLVDGEFYDEALDIIVSDLNHSEYDTKGGLLRTVTKLADRAMDGNGLDDPKRDPRWGQIQANRYVGDRVAVTSPPEESKFLFEELLEWALERDDLETAADANQFLSETLTRVGRPKEALAAIQRCRDFAQQAGDTRREARAYNVTAMLLNEAHDHVGANENADRAVELLRSLGRSLRLGWAVLTSANINVQLQNFAKAEDLTREGLAIFRDEGSIGGQASAHVIFAQNYRFSGRLMQAEAAARRGLDLYVWAGLGTHYLSLLVLIAVHVERRNYDAAIELFEATYDDLRSKNMGHYIAHMKTSVMTAYAVRGDLQTFDRFLSDAWAFWEAGNFDSDLPRLLSLSASVLESIGEHDRARLVRERLARYDSMVHENTQRRRERDD